MAGVVALWFQHVFARRLEAAKADITRQMESFKADLGVKADLKKAAYATMAAAIRKGNVLVAAAAQTAAFYHHVAETSVVFGDDECTERAGEDSREAMDSCRRFVNENAPDLSDKTREMILSFLGTNGPRQDEVLRGENGDLESRRRAIRGRHWTEERGTRGAFPGTSQRVTGTRRRADGSNVIRF